MYSNQSLYYLQQIGIFPWITRKPPTPVGPRLIVFIAESLSEPAKNLVYKILLSLVLDEKELLIIHLKEKMSADEIQQDKPPLGLIFGDDLKKLLPQKHLDTAIITLDPVSLLENPIKKKEVLAHLSQVQRLLVNES
jgi:hypothetical protein